jgi:hypothetical protein
MIKRIIFLLALIITLNPFFIFSINIQPTESGAFTGIFADNLNTYANKFEDNFDTLLGTMTDSFSQNNVVQPVYASSHKTFTFGISLGLGWSTEKLDDTDAGGKTLNQMRLGSPSLFKDAHPLSFGMGSSAFITIYLDQLELFSRNSFFLNSSFTFKAMYYDYSFVLEELNTAEVFDTGAIFRKNFYKNQFSSQGIISFNGIRISTGLFYNYSNLYFKNIAINETETFTGSNYQVQFDAENATLEIDTSAFTLDAEILTGFRFFTVLDIFGGIGFSWGIISKATIDGILNGTLISRYDIDNDGSYESSQQSNQGFTADGSTQGRTLVPRIMLGVRLDFDLIKIPFQYSVSYSHLTIKTFTTGLSFSF